jgi:hypothetical protein
MRAHKRKQPHEAAVSGADRAIGLSALADHVLQVAGLFLHFAFDLVGQALGLLFFAADGFTETFLDLATDVFGFAFDLVFVHDISPIVSETGFVSEAAWMYLAPIAIAILFAT